MRVSRVLTPGPSIQRDAGSHVVRYPLHELMLDRMVLVDDRRRGAVPLSVAHPPAVFPSGSQRNVPPGNGETWRASGKDAESDAYWTYARIRGQSLVVIRGRHNRWNVSVGPTGARRSDLDRSRTRTPVHNMLPARAPPALVSVRRAAYRGGASRRPHGTTRLFRVSSVIISISANAEHGQSTRRRAEPPAPPPHGVPSAMSARG
jgi:hypothetical protein